MCEQEKNLAQGLVILFFAFIFAGCSLTDDLEFDTKNEDSEITTPVGEDAGMFWRASWGGSLQGLPSDRYVPDHMPLDRHFLPLKIVITDIAMLHDFFADTYSLSLNEAGDGWVRDERFSDSIAKYDNTFFKSRQLVTFFLTAAGGAYEFKLTGTTYTDGTLNINIDHISIGGGHAALVEWFAIVETNKVPADAAINVNVTDEWGRVYTF